VDSTVDSQQGRVLVATTALSTDERSLVRMSPFVELTGAALSEPLATSLLTADERTLTGVCTDVSLETLLQAERTTTYGAHEPTLGCGG
jgi:hypothetical protein